LEVSIPSESKDSQDSFDNFLKEKISEYNTKGLGNESISDSGSIRSRPWPSQNKEDDGNPPREGLSGYELDYDNFENLQKQLGGLSLEFLESLDEKRSQVGLEGSALSMSPKDSLENKSLLLDNLQDPKLPIQFEVVLANNTLESCQPVASAQNLC
jgi:hypothetical protein